MYFEGKLVFSAVYPSISKKSPRIGADNSETTRKVSLRHWRQEKVLPMKQEPSDVTRRDPLSDVSAGTALRATADSAGASARYHIQDGRHPGDVIFCALLPGVACVPCVTVKMACKVLRFNDV